jgi:hypothetical protein
MGLSPKYVNFRPWIMTVMTRYEQKTIFEGWLLPINLFHILQYSLHVPWWCERLAINRAATRV